MMVADMLAQYTYGWQDISNTHVDAMAPRIPGIMQRSMDIVTSHSPKKNMPWLKDENF